MRSRSRFGCRIALARAALVLLATLTAGIAAAQSDIDRAAERVGELYALHDETKDAGGDTVLAGGELTRRFFHPVTALAMQGRELPFDPIYNGPADEVTGIDVFADPDKPLQDGTAFIIVALERPSGSQRLRYSLRQVEGSPEWWIIGIDGPDWSLNELLLK